MSLTQCTSVRGRTSVSAVYLRRNDRAPRLRRLKPPRLGVCTRVHPQRALQRGVAPVRQRGAHRGEAARDDGARVRVPPAELLSQRGNVRRGRRREGVSVEVRRVQLLLLDGERRLAPLRRLEIGTNGAGGGTYNERISSQNTNSVQVSHWGWVSASVDRAMRISIRGRQQGSKHGARRIIKSSR